MLITSLILTLLGCATQQVAVPCPPRAKAPAELLQPLKDETEIDAQIASQEIAQCQA